MGAIIAGAIGIILWIFKLVITMMVLMIPGIIVGKIAYKLKLTFISMIIVFLLFIGIGGGIGIYSAIATLISMVMWKSINRKKAIKNSIMLRKEGYLSLAALITQIIAINLLGALGAEGVAIIVIMPIGAIGLIGNIKSNYKQLMNLIKEKGIITKLHIRIFVEEKQKDDKKDKKDKEEYYDKLVDLIECMAIYEDNITVFEGEKEKYYVFNETNKEVVNMINKLLDEKSFYTVKELLLSHKIFGVLGSDTEIFLRDTIPSMQYGHYQNEEIVTRLSDSNKEGLCECCQVYSSQLINTPYGNFCSVECSELMDNIYSRIHESKESNRKEIIVDAQTLHTQLPIIIGTDALKGVTDKQNYYTSKTKSKSDASHGFAAEVVNTDIDNLLGRNASVIGGDNAKNGADRIVDGIKVQTKYYQRASETVNSAFEGGNYRYMDKNTPMKLEVPRDQYEEAIKLFEHKIRQGEVKGVKDTKQAKEIVRKGALTYQQSRNITKMGTIESLVYDFYSGAVVGINSGSIAATITFGLQVLNGEDIEDAVKVTAATFFSTGAKVTVASTVTAQLNKSTLMKSIKQTGGKELSELALKGISSGVFLAVFSYKDFLQYFNGQISGEKLTQRLIETGVVMGVSSIASIGASKLAVGVLGLSFGAPLIGPLAGVVAGQIASHILGNDEKKKKRELEKMQTIFMNVFRRFAYDQLLSNKEIQKIYIRICENNPIQLFERMIDSKQPYQYIYRTLMQEVAISRSEQNVLKIINSAS